jgi:hypothetical protein
MVPTGESSVLERNEFIVSMIKKIDANFLYRNNGAGAFFANENRAVGGRSTLQLQLRERG